MSSEVFVNNSETKIFKKSNKAELNINIKCRACLKEESNMKYLFINYERDLTLAKMVEETTGFVVLKEDGMPQYICEKCTSIVVNFFNFKFIFRNTTEYLGGILCKSDTVENKTDTNLEQFKHFHQVSNKNKIDEKKCIDLDYEIESNGGCDSDSDEVSLKERLLLLISNKELENLTGKECDSDINFKSDIKLQSHMKLKHRGSKSRTVNAKRKKSYQKKSFIKNSVEKLLETSDIPNNHNLQLNDEKPSKMKHCSICKQTFSEEEFDLHSESHKTHVCRTCGHRFRRKTDLNDHEEIHLEVCKYVCHHCGKAFRVRTALAKHRRIHTNPREEVCDVCGQRFNSRDTLKIHHKLKHIRSKDFQCYLCGLAFTLKSTLDKHIERHNPNREKIYACNLCSVSYKNKYNLTRHHVIKHTAFENKPTCEFCGKGYTKKIDLNKHIKKHHEQSHVKVELKKKNDKV